MEGDDDGGERSSILRESRPSVLFKAAELCDVGHPQPATHKQRRRGGRIGRSERKEF